MSTDAPAAVDEGRDLSYLHCPFLDPADYLRALAYLTPPPRPEPQWTRPAWLTVPYVDEVFEQIDADDWYRRGFTDADRDMWVQYGLRRHDADTAERCLRLGLPPAALQLVVDGRLVADRLRAGERVESVLARLRQQPPVAGDGSE